jgi:DNA-binding transcriptional regulator YiaG
MHDQLTLQADQPTFQAAGPLREWTGRDAVALRMTEAKFARAVDVSPRTVANWHTKPDTVPLNAAQDLLDELLNGASEAVVQRFERFAGHQPAPSRPAPAEAGSHAVPAAGGTLLRELVRERHWEYETFCAEYEKATAQTATYGGAPSRAQYYRWLTGQLKRGVPYPGACRALEAMFAPWKAAELFGPPPAAPDAALAAIPAQARPLGDLAALVAGARDSRAINVSGGQVVALSTHPRYAADFKPLSSGLVASARTTLGLTLPEFAALIESALGWVVMPEAVGRWETESVPPGDVVLFCQAFLADAHGGGVTAPDARGRDELTVRRAARRQR